MIIEVVVTVPHVQKYIDKILEEDAKLCVMLGRFVAAAVDGDDVDFGLCREAARRLEGTPGEEYIIGIF